MKKCRIAWLACMSMAGVLLAGCATNPSGPRVSPSEVRVYYQKPKDAVVVRKLHFDLRMDFDAMRRAVADAGGNAMFLSPAAREKHCGPYVPKGCGYVPNPQKRTLEALKVPARSSSVFATVGQTATTNGAPEVEGAIPTLPIAPRYPAFAQLQCIEGVVKLGFNILPNGHVSKIQVLSAKPENVFEMASIRALGHSFFAPELVHHLPVAAHATYTYHFTMPTCSDRQARDEPQTSAEGPAVDASHVKVYFHKPVNAVVIAKLPYHRGMDYDQMRAAVAKAGGNAMLLTSRPIKICHMPVAQACSPHGPQPDWMLEAMNVPASAAGGDGPKGSMAAARQAHHVAPPDPAGTCLRGEVTLGFVILPSGHVRDVHVINSKPPGVFDAASTDALKRSVFRPKLVDHIPVATQAQYTYRFVKPCDST